MNDDNKPVDGQERRNIIEGMGEIRALALQLTDVQKLLHELELTHKRALEVPRIVAADLLAPVADTYRAVLEMLARAGGEAIPNSEAETNKNG